MKTLTVLVGPPGSGKSTAAKTLPGVYINQDAQGRDHYRLFLEAVGRGDDIVLDRMNFNREQRDRYTIPAKATGYDVTIRTFVVPRQVCMSRVLARKDHETIKDASAANGAINLFFSKYEKPLAEEGTLEWVTYGGGVGEDKPKALIVDLDGTLCDLTHRRHFVRGEGKKDWKSFFQGISSDAVNEPVAEMIRRYSVDHKIIYASGRPENYRDVTEAWLKKNNLWYNNLHMRSTGDHRDDTVAKGIILEFDILTQCTPVLFLDDRDRVVQFYRDLGYSVFQVNPGDF